MTFHATSSCHPFLAPLRTDAPTHHGEETHVCTCVMCGIVRYGETNVMETFGVLAVCTSDGRVDQVHILKQVLQKNGALYIEKDTSEIRMKQRFTGCGGLGNMYKRIYIIYIYICLLVLHICSIMLLQHPLNIKILVGKSHIEKSECKDVTPQ